MKMAVIAAAAAFAVTCSAGALAADAYPTKPVRIIVPFSAGGNTDLVARAIAEPMSRSLGQKVIVENRPGASGIPGALYVKRAAPDGYTVLAASNTFAVVPSLIDDVGYDPLKDFDGISVHCLVPQVLVVTPSLPVNSVKELIALAKAHPGELEYGSAGVGGTGHMAAALFNRAAGIKMLHVPYKGNAPAVIDVMAGRVALMFDQISTSMNRIKAGKLKALAVTSKKRSPLFPNLPTIAESGVPGYEDITFNGLVAPAGTPPAILERLNAEVKKAVRIPSLHEKFIEQGVELEASPSPKAFDAFIKAEFEKKARLAREANIHIKR